MSWGGSGAALARLSKARWTLPTGGRSSPPAARTTPKAASAWSAACGRAWSWWSARRKSVAELGVIGRAEDMHCHLGRRDRDATLEYLDQVAREQGGRGGRAQVRTGTGGLTWAVSRHATTRSWRPPAPRPRLDHQRRAHGGHQGRLEGTRHGAACVTTCHAATAVGRIAAAARAVDLGYGIEPDPGTSGSLGSFAISGIPKEAWEFHATRSAQIDAAVGREASYEARSMAARTTRDKKEHTMR